MVKAHEEKIAAMTRIENQYKAQLEEMQARVATPEEAAAQTTPTSGNSFAFHATNKELTEKVAAYRIFISEYIVKAQEEKFKAVQAAEAKVAAKYEAVMEELKKKGSS